MKKDSGKYKYSTFANLNYALGGAKKWKKSVLLCVAVQAITAGLFSYVWLYAAKLIIEQIESGIKTSFQYITYIVVIAAAIEIILLVGKEISYRQLENGMLQVRMNFILMSMKKVFKMPYEMMENPDVLDAKKKGDWAIENMTRGIEGIVKCSAQLFANLIIMLIATIILVKVNAFVAIIIFALAIWRLVFQDKVAKWEKDEIYGRLAPENRKVRYYNDVTQNFDYAKDIRLFEMQNALGEKQANLHDYIHSRILILHNKWRSCWLAGRGVELPQEGFMYAWLVFEVIVHGMSIADFTLYIGSIRSFNSAVSLFLDYFAQMRQNSRTICDYRTFLEYPDKPQDEIKKSSFSNDFTRIMGSGQTNETRMAIPQATEYTFRFDTVSFKYPGRDEYALKNLSITLEAGKRLAVVGLNGAGKTTFIKLLCRLYKPVEGTIYMNDININAFDRDEYYKLIAPVFQNVECFAFPLAENVSMSEPCNTDKKLAESSLENAGLGDKVKSLEKGVHTEMLKILYEDGIDLSGGEKQKMLLARALYKNAPIVVLDEPTAAFDPIAERKMYMDFDKLIGDKTAVYISHRLSSTRFCHSIAMFANGELIEYGTHDELIKANKSYAQMFELQSQYYKEEVDIFA
ncbi:MAG: ABC transporter ATP-binding protein [Oscillospiraceae bacterium]